MSLRSLAGLGLVAMALPALAASSGQATLGNLQFQLTDLAPADGTSPSLAWTRPFDWLGANGQENTQIGWVPFEGAMSWQLGTSDIRQAVVEPGTGILASMSSAHQWGASFASATALGAVATADSGQVNAGAAVSVRSFVLSPHTQATLTAQLDYWFSVDNFVWQAQPADQPLYLQSAGSGALVVLYGASADGSFTQQLNFQQQLGISQPNQTSAASSGTENESIVFTNDSDLPVTYTFQSTLILSASQTGALPVPEPAGYALLLAGLGLVGVAMRRKKALAS